MPGQELDVLDAETTEAASVDLQEADHGICLVPQHGRNYECGRKGITPDGKQPYQF
jgi:hypothetical protein